MGNELRFDRVSTRRAGFRRPQRAVRTKKPLILAAVIFCLSSIGTGMADHFQVFVIWRILGGFAIGLASSLSPVYIAELAPAHLRGKLVSMNQLTIVCGILLAQVVNWLIARPISPTATASEILNSWNGQVGWRWMFAVTAIPSLLFLYCDVLRSGKSALACQAWRAR